MRTLHVIALLLATVSTAAGAAAKRDAAPAPKKEKQLPGELKNLKPEDRPRFKSWQRRSATTIAGVKVSQIEVGAKDAPKPTILHFHGAGVDYQNILVWRLARAARAQGKPIRIISVEHEDAEHVLKAMKEPVALMGHSAGTGVASWLARKYPDKVTKYIGLAPVPRALLPGLRVPSTIIHGTDDDVIPVQYSRFGRFLNGTRMIEMRGVDHSLRYRPGGDEGGSKADHNLTPESDVVARQVMTLIHGVVGR
jgi:hypothetical protein